MTNLHSWIGKLLGLEDVRSIESIETSWASPWAHNSPAYVFFGCLALAAVALTVYLKYQASIYRKTRLALAAARALVLCLLLIVLADPVLTVKLVHAPRPQLWFLFDGTDSMAIEDTMPEEEHERLAKAVELAKLQGSADPAKTTRADYVRAWLRKKDHNAISRLEEKFRLSAFLFDRAEGVRTLDWNSAGAEKFDPERAATLLTTEGQVTALGKALEDLAQRRATGDLAGLVMVSDFDQNAGPPPLAKARQLGVPVYTIGVGPLAAVDLAVDLQAPPVMKKSERSTILVVLRQNGLDGQSVTLQLTARPLGTSQEAAAPGGTISLGQRTVPLKGSSLTVDFPYRPTTWNPRVGCRTTSSSSRSWKQRSRFFRSGRPGWDFP